MATIAPEDHHIDIDVVEARQGLRGRHALIILIVSTLLTIGVFMAAYAMNHRNLASVNSAPIATASEAQQANAPVAPAH
ncbi:MAG: hypothetical protein JWM33_3816 [Caulobacteraceae bacterium]|nr:hypothetical protein [Caulobacteraceae bacterium]